MLNSTLSELRLGYISIKSILYEINRNSPPYQQSTTPKDKATKTRSINSFKELWAGLATCRLFFCRSHELYNVGSIENKSQEKQRKTGMMALGW